MVEIQGVVLEDSENPSIHGRSYHSPASTTIDELAGENARVAIGDFTS
jgi:hypothetical protein